MLIILNFRILSDVLGREMSLREATGRRKPAFLRKRVLAFVVDYGFNLKILESYRSQSLLDSSSPQLSPSQIPNLTPLLTLFYRKKS